MGRRKSMRVRTSRIANLTDQFMITPNGLIRGEGVWGNLNAHERILLLSGLSSKDDWETTMEDIEGWLPELGRDRHEGLRRSLREKGFMTLRQERVDSGPDAGMFVWSMSFYMEPLPEGQRDRLKPKTAKPRSRKDDVSAGDSMPVNSGPDEDQGAGDVHAGDSMPGHAGHGGAGDRGAGPARQGSTPYIEKDQEKKTNTSPPPGTSSPGTHEHDLSRGEGKNSSYPPEAGQSLINQAVDWVTERLPQPVARHPRFSRTILAEVLGAAVAQELGSLREAAIALLLIADGKYGPITMESSARRLLVSGGQWWADARAAAATKKAAAVEDQEPCPEPAHIGGFVGNCKQCKGEAKGRCPKEGHTGAEIACPQCAAETAGDGVEGAEGTGTLERPRRAAQRDLVVA